jgi:hypothetical protein
MQSIKAGRGMKNAGGEGEGGTQGQSLGLVQLSRGRAAGEECNTCGKTDGHPMRKRCRWEGQNGGVKGGAQHRVSVSRRGGNAWHQQGGSSSGATAAAAA